MGGISPTAGVAQNSREQQRDLAGARAHGWNPLAAALPGQFVVLRLKPAPGAPALMRSYSLSGEPGARRYRISVKREPHGVAGAYIDEKVQLGDMLDVSAPRGSFTLRQATLPLSS